MQRGYVYMLRFRKKDSKELIKRMAKTNGCSVSEFQRLFGNKIPSPEEFICVVSKNLKF